jgi:5-methylcytosine-specific restriction endonuclease McrA
MSVTSKTNQRKLDSRFDDSDPTAKTLESEIMTSLNIKESTLYGLLPAKRFERKEGYILGIKLSKDDDVLFSPPIFSACPVVSISREDLEEEQEVSEKQLIIASEPEQTLYELKESARQANNKVAEKYKTLSSTQSAKKKEPFPDWFKSRIWRKFNGSLEKTLCPVCSDSLIEPNSFSAGHILPESKGGMMCLENIMPICGDCNSQMGSRHLYWFAWHYYGNVMWSVY